MGAPEGADTGHISIHALLAESDLFAVVVDVDYVGISIHALLAESDLRPEYPTGDMIAFLSTLSLRRATYQGFRCVGSQSFLSTLSLRRATMGSIVHSKMRKYFYPRSPCGERLLSAPINPHPPPYFYPRSPCGERLCRSSFLLPDDRFLSTLSLRRATFFPKHSLPDKQYFYPRSPCGERHHVGMEIWTKHKDFYPRSPCGERPSSDSMDSM